MDRSALKLVDFSKVGRGAADSGAGFPYGLAKAGVHEVCARRHGDGPVAAGFALAAGQFAGLDGAVAWIRLAREALSHGAVQGHGLAGFGVLPGRCLDIAVRKPAELLWACEEAVMSSAVACVVAECRDLDFTSSRRLTLVSQARGTPVILLMPHTREGATAAAGRWRVAARPSASNRLNPRGLGRARWEAELERSRTAPGATGQRYLMEFDNETFSLHLVGRLGAGQAAPHPPDPATAGSHEAGLRQAG